MQISIIYCFHDSLYWFVQAFLIQENVNIVSGFPDRNRQQMITSIDYLKQISLSVCGTRAALKS